MIAPSPTIENSVISFSGKGSDDSDEKEGKAFRMKKKKEFSQTYTFSLGHVINVTENIKNESHESAD